MFFLVRKHASELYVDNVMHYVDKRITGKLSNGFCE
jgi:hypothetical protein